jgi:hypothetical protein
MPSIATVVMADAKVNGSLQPQLELVVQLWGRALSIITKSIRSQSLFYKRWTRRLSRSRRPVQPLLQFLSLELLP